MIEPYEFIDANAQGNKEPVQVPNIPTKVNKLSAAETNRIKDKLNEIIDEVNDPENKPQPILITATATGANQVFTNIPFQAGTVLKSKGELFKGSEWTQTGNTITILTNVNTGNTIYIKP